MKIIDANQPPPGWVVTTPEERAEIGDYVKGLTADEFAAIWQASIVSTLTEDVDPPADNDERE